MVMMTIPSPLLSMRNSFIISTICVYPATATKQWIFLWYFLHLWMNESFEQFDFKKIILNKKNFFKDLHYYYWTKKNRQYKNYINMSKTETNKQTAKAKINCQTRMRMRKMPLTKSLWWWLCTECVCKHIITEKKATKIKAFAKIWL